MKADGISRRHLLDQKPVIIWYAVDGPIKEGGAEYLCGIAVGRFETRRLDSRRSQVCGSV